MNLLYLGIRFDQLYIRMLQLGIKSSFIPLFNVVVDKTQLSCLQKNINNFDLIIFTSPMAIKFSKDVLSHVSNDVEFAVVGEASFNRLSQFTKNKIYYPVYNSGALFLINEQLTKLDLPNYKIAVVRGNLGDATIVNWFKVNIVVVKLMY